MGRRAPDDRASAGLPRYTTGEVTVVEPNEQLVEPAEQVLDVERVLPRKRNSAEITVSALPGERDPDVLLASLPARFTVERVLGRGGMGIVVAAYDRTLQREVAIKMIVLDHENPLMRERFLREARAAAPLRHRGIVQVYDIDPDGKYIVMELVRGESLAARLDRQASLPAPEVKRIGRALADALAVAHAAGVVHRDVKPANILLCESGDVKLADFGVAQFGNSELTAPGVQVGTPAYMAPEQLRGHETDARADIYAAGATLFKAATGQGLHDVPGKRDVAADVLVATGDRILADVIAQSVRENPAERFADGRALRGALGGGISRALSAWPTNDRGSPRRPRLRLRLALLGIAAAAVLGVGGWQLARHGSSDRHATAATSSPVGLIAIEPIRWTTWSYAGGSPNPGASGDVIAILLDQIDGIHAVGSTELAGTAEASNASAGRWEEAARSVDAKYLVRGAIDEKGTAFHATFEILSLTGGPTITLKLEGAAIPELMNDIAERIAQTFDSRKTLSRAPDLKRARLLYSRGQPKLVRLDFNEARPFLDQAVNADPSYFEAWYALASVRSWMMAPSAEVLEAINMAYEKAGAGTKKQLMDGASRFMRHDYAGARAALEPLAALSELTKFEQRDVLYYLGEAHWHDGHHETGVRYFRRAVELDGRFKPAAIHLGEYALAHRDEGLSSYASGLLESADQDSLEFMRGHYEVLASRAGGFRLPAIFVLGQIPTADMEANAGMSAHDRYLYLAARAFGDGDPAAARKAIDEFWAFIATVAQGDTVPDSTYYLLKMLGDVVLCAGDAEQARRIVTFMAERSKVHPVYGYQRLSILAAPLMRDRAMIIRDGLTDRERQLADAIEAEMTGNRARAAELLTTLVADPTPSWDYPERVALLRNLRALKRSKEAHELCADVQRPPVFRWAFLPTRRECARR